MVNSIEVAGEDWGWEHSREVPRSSMVPEDTRGRKEEARSRFRMRRTRRVSFGDLSSCESDAVKQVKVHVELNPADLIGVLEDVSEDESDMAIDIPSLDLSNEEEEEAYSSIGEDEGSTDKSVTESLEEVEATVEDDTSDTTSDDEFTLDHVMSKWGAI